MNQKEPISRQSSTNSAITNSKHYNQVGLDSENDENKKFEMIDVTRHGQKIKILRLKSNSTAKNDGNVYSNV